MFSNSILNFQESTSIFNTHTKNVCKIIVYPSYICLYIFVYRYVYHYHHHVMPQARISLTLFFHFSLSFFASGKSSALHLYNLAGRPAFSRPYVGVHRSTSLMSSSLLLQQCPACLVRLTWIVFVIGHKWPYSWCLVGCPPGLVQYCSQHSCVIAV